MISHQRVFPVVAHRIPIWSACVLAALLLATGPGLAVSAENAPDYPRVSSFTPPDLTWVPRTLAKEPAYVSINVRYCIFVLGDGRKSVMAMAWDESEGTGKGYDTLYVDTNLNGILGEEGERFFWSNEPAKRPEEKEKHERYLVANVKEAGSDRVYSFRFAGVYQPDILQYDSGYRMSAPSLSYDVGPLPGDLKLLWGSSLATAPVYRFGGEPIPTVNGKHAGEALGSWKAGENVTASVWLALHGTPEGAQLRFYGAKFPALAAAVRDNRWGKAGYPIVLLRVLDPATRQLREIIPFGDSCPCAGGFAPQMILPSRVPSGAHEVVVRMLRVPELGGCADFVWPVTVENLFEKNPVTDPAFAALKQQFPDATFATLRRADTAAERATLRDGEKVIPAAAADTTLLPNNRDWDARHANFGAESHLTVGQRPHQHADLRSLLRFDLTGVPQQTEILGARLRLALIVVSEGGAPTYTPEDSLEAFALLRPWNERQDESEGWACWFGPRFRGKLRSEKWAQEGAAGEGTDRDAKPAGATTAMSGFPDKARNELVRFVDMDLTELVKAWQSGTRPNYGLLLQMRGKGGGPIASSEQGDYPFRPALVIAYRGATPAPTYAPRPGEDLAQALQQAALTKRPLVMRFYTQTCGICKKVEATTFKDDRVIKALNEMLVVKVDAERHMEQAKALGVDSVPAILIVEPDVVAAGVSPADAGRAGGTPAPTANKLRVIAHISAEQMMQPETLLPKLALAMPARPRVTLPRGSSDSVGAGVPPAHSAAAAGTITGFQKEDGSGASVVATRVLALASPDALFLSAICPEPKPESIVAKADARDADQVWQDDCIEFFVEPVKGSGEERHFAVSASGNVYDSRNGDKAWNGDWTATAKRTAEGWSVEVRIPWATLGLTGQPKPGAEIGFNSGRVRNADGESSQWSPTEGSSHQPVKFGTLRVE